MRGIIMTAILAAGTAQAETRLGAEQLDGLLTGNTVYLETPAGEAPVLYGADGRAAALLPDGTALVGTWSIDADGYCIDWENGPKGSCTRATRMPGAIALTDAATGDPRGRILRVVPGNPEDL